MGKVLFEQKKSVSGRTNLNPGENCIASSEKFSFGGLFLILNARSL